MQAAVKGSFRGLYLYHRTFGVVFGVQAVSNLRAILSFAKASPLSVRLLSDNAPSPEDSPASQKPLLVSIPLLRYAQFDL